MKKILFNTDARLQIKAGIDKCCDVVKVSMGGYGKNVMIYNGQTTDIINDGTSIANAVEVKNEIEQAGIQLAKQCAQQTNIDAGDGTTTTLVLLQSILNEIIGDFQTENPRELREKLFREANEVLSKIEVKQIAGRQDIYNLALTSSLDPKIAEVVADVYEELGKDAQISLEEVNRDVLEKEIIGGMKIDTKRAESKILNNTEKEVIEDCKVLVLDKASLEEVKPIVDKLGDIKNLVIIANQFSRQLLLAIMRANVNIIPLEYTMFNTIEDIKDYVGDEIVDKVIITPESITIIGGKGKVEDKVKLLKEKLAKEESIYEKENIEKRIAQLLGKVAIIRIGKNTEVERIESYLKLEDALGSVKGAYEMGYCKGGGLALKEAGGRDAVYKQICQNAGKDIEIPETVIDSFKTVKYSLLNALSTATSILMVEAALIQINDNEKEVYN
jgi:chaperonin GroEL